MRTCNVSFLAVLSCIAMIGATPIENRSLAEARQFGGLPYVALQQLVDVLTRLKPFLQ